jgi:dTDP-4-dehydrorhamnose 3,5-epimerase-like enzyme
VVVDLRKGSPTYGKTFSIELTSENRKQLLVPKGMAHGYSVLSETAEVLYKCDEFYNKPSEEVCCTMILDWQLTGEYLSKKPLSPTRTSPILTWKIAGIISNTLSNYLFNKPPDSW